MAKFPTQGEIKFFDISQLVQDVQQVLNDMVRSKGKAKVTRAKFTFVKDCILCHLIVYFVTLVVPGQLVTWPLRKVTLQYGMMGVTLFELLIIRQTTWD